MKFTPKHWSDLCNFYSKVIFGILSKKIFFFLFFFGLIWIIDISQQHCENFRKIEQVELGEKSASKIPTLQISA